ncbi:MAG: alkaline phosphatase, partial [bacterium]|nr:alkaline phosphatase [bacterium]
MLRPDSIASYKSRGTNQLIVANEGDTRDYACYSDQVRVKDLTLDAMAFPIAATLQDSANIGRLKTTP